MFTQTILLCLLVITTSAYQENNSVSGDRNDITEPAREGKGGFPNARRILAEIARELVQRTTTNSQVLSLNLTNIVILLVLKALLFGAGIFSFGLLKNGRSINDIPGSPLSLSDSEILLLLTYLMGDATERYDCLNRVACEEPKKAGEYVAAAKMLIKGAKALNKAIPYNPKYENIVLGLQRAVELGSNGGRCDMQYSCSKQYKS